MVSFASDVQVAISDNGGQTFGYAHLLSHGLAANDAGTGGQVDNPVIASHVASPYSIYAAWTSAGSSVGFITQVVYHPDFTLGPLTPLPQARIPSNTSNIYHPGISMGQVLACDGTTQHEAVYVAWEDNIGIGCPAPDGGISTVSWYYDAFDTVTQLWLPGGPWKADTDFSWPGCVGNPFDGGEQYSENDARPRIVAEPSNDLFWIAYIKSSTSNGVGGSRYGTQINVYQQELICTGGSYAPVLGSVWAPFPDCYSGNCNFTTDGGAGYNSADGGGYTVNDEWGPAIAFLRNPGTGSRELVATWYDTRGDKNNTNVTIWGASSVGFSTNALPLTGTFQVGTGTGTPWNHSLAPWRDYQALSPEPVTNTFLNVWSGDARLITQFGLWSAVIK